MDGDKETKEGKKEEIKSHSNMNRTRKLADLNPKLLWRFGMVFVDHRKRINPQIPLSDLLSLLLLLLLVHEFERDKVPVQRER